MLARSAVALTALSLSRLLAQAPARNRKLAVTIDDGPAVGVGNDLAAFTRVADALRETFVAEKVPAIMFVNERQLNVDGQRYCGVGRSSDIVEASLRAILSAVNQQMGVAPGIAA